MTRKMKDSGVEWIGEIPVSWEIDKIGQIYIERKEKVSDKDFAPLSVTMQGVVPQLSTAAKTDAHDDRKLVRKGDFAINSRSDRRGSCGISPYDGSVSLINTILEPREAMHPGYYNWLFHTSLFADEYYKWGHGIVDDLWTTNWKDMKSINIPSPSIDEQQRIADYLDRKIAKIDEAIEKTRSTIEEYKALKQSIITKAVTKGIRGDRPMKDSGIEWIGEIPEDWELSKLKYNAKVRNRKYSSNDGALEYFALENIVSWAGKHISTSNEYDINQSIICEQGDVVFGKLRPYLAKVYSPTKKCCCSSEFAVFYDFNGISEYFKYLFLSYGFVDTVDASTYGTKMPRANIEFIKNMEIAVPHFEEQEEIIEYLDKKCSAIDELITKKEKIMTELESYKKSLMYEYVTGKKEVAKC